MENEAGSAFAHYLRTDQSGARPIRPELLEAWIERGWLERVAVPARQPYPTKPCVVLDPFGGSGTVAQVATGNGRDAIYIDLNPKYLELARQRIGPMFVTEAA
jgi:hypothetical protein